MARKKQITCKDCHRYIRVDGQDCCTNTDNIKTTFLVLKNTEICPFFWKADNRLVKREIPLNNNELIVSDRKKK